MDNALIARRPGKQTQDFFEALDKLLDIAESDTGQGLHVANFLLAWWNAQTCGGFDLTDLWAVDLDIARRMFVIMQGIVNYRMYPDSLGYSTRFEALIHYRRPHLLEQQD
ncbi:hypothetical protein A167_00698 [Alcanivorax sp. S71-1-4]|uniref:DUF7673 family protein n=1 Tax=Alcanivorax sp. S71-1-4 TaxID=1177159 RepID=UPI0016976CB8|nr:hypothetical protein [Alcanivorax sp. S71-1-4]KAF0810418.1 hypothetical protein A167_00698 [Alcanivorax sp. S71-1-4]